MSGVRATYKFFVGNLPWTVGHNELQAYFSKFGPVASAHVIFDKHQGFSKGYGFVLYHNWDAYQSVCNHFAHFLDGRVLKVEQSSS